MHLQFAVGALVEVFLGPFVRADAVVCTVEGLHMTVAVNDLSVAQDTLQYGNRRLQDGRFLVHETQCAYIRVLSQEEMMTHSNECVRQLGKLGSAAKFSDE